LRTLRQEKRIRIIDRTASVIGIALFLLFFLQHDAYCQLKSFSPTVTNWFGKVEIYSTYETNKNTISGRGTEVSRFDMYEKVTIGIGGFVYHPRFAIYNLSVGFGIQESYFKSLHIEGWDYGTLEEYDVKILFLPTHIYSFELFSRRRNPYIQQSQSPGLSPINYEHGINMYYEKRSLKLNLGYVFESLRIADIRTDTHTVRFGAGHHYRSSKTRLNFTHIDSRNLTDSISDTLHANNRFIYRNMTLYSKIAIQEFDQVNRVNPMTDKLFDWEERLVVDILEDLSASGTYKKRKFERVNGITALNENVSYGFGLRHRYYDSINTSYSYSKSEYEALSSRSEVEANGLRVSYRKRIRSGMLLASYTGRRSDTLRVGSLRIINESHEATLSLPDDTFPLDERGVEESSITLNIIEPVTGRRLELIRNVHYIIETIGNQTFITIISLSGISPRIIGEGPFTFLASYTLPEAQTLYETVFDLYSIRLELFDRTVIPYYSINTSKQNELEGEIPGGAEDSKTQIFGLSIRRRTVFLNAEYHKAESRFSPLTSWNVRAEYQDRYSERTSVFVKMLYRQTNYEDGEGFSVSRPSLREEIFTLNSRANFIFPRRNITVFAGPSFTYRKSQHESFGIGLAAGLNWRLGLLTLNTGLSYKYLETQLPDSDLVSQNTFFYFRAVRDLF